MAHACKLGGADAVDIVYLYDLLSGEVKLDDYHFLNLPGGFLDGDDLGSAKAMAHRMKHARIGGSGERLEEATLRFIREGKLILGICNGFQSLVNLGLLPGWDGSYRERRVALTCNDSGNFIDTWISLKVNPLSPCVFTRGMSRIDLPVRHGEGKFYASPRDLDRLTASGQVVMQYADEGGREARGRWPLNPNGSLGDIAGICDPTGRVFGLMPHPEAFHHYTNHPDWARRREALRRRGSALEGTEGDGVRVFRNAVEYLKQTQ